MIVGILMKINGNIGSFLIKKEKKEVVVELPDKHELRLGAICKLSTHENGNYELKDYTDYLRRKGTG
ncbi:hypothetical protein EDD63_1501 [Breznakia blatticola]|uniref:Uncharacterized protein n=1 Tax=Breznakia blatticola TaxID=1754012 RepID=A0A4R7Z9Q0_9FIRM|nr:hypothetical protein [Breznakia blatticola]TDW13095.1 hypothetical protein EDD63_1501 [Breznakia blatticola]